MHQGRYRCSQDGTSFIKDYKYMSRKQLNFQQIYEMISDYVKSTELHNGVTGYLTNLMLPYPTHSGLVYTLYMQLNGLHVI